MLEERFTYPSPAGDGVQLSAVVWKGEAGQSRKGMVQIAHGMVEHIGRYLEFAEFLTRHGYVVAGADHRAHGQTASSPENIGILTEIDAFERMVADLHPLSLWLRQQYPDLPLILLGHSMGSFLAQRYLQIYGDDIDACILSGSNGKSPLHPVAKHLASLLRTVQGPARRSPFLNALAFGSYNKAFAPTRTEFDWLSRDEAEVDKYIADPWCGAICSTGFYYALLSGLVEIAREENIANVPVDLPLLLLSGEKDPVGENGAGVERLWKAYQSHGMRKLSKKLYPDGRHEMLHEINRQQVQEDILAWIQRMLGR